jgi:hypothetical protein
VLSIGLVVAYLVMMVRASPSLTLCISLVLVHKYARLYVFAVIASGLVEALTSLSQSFFGKG